MVTTFDPNNAFNLAETAAVATIKGDSWLGDTANVALVHQKVRLGDQGDEAGLYYDHELPVIAVMAEGGSADGKHTIGEFEEFVRLTFEVWVSEADLDATDTKAKEIVARLRSLMRLQTFSPSNVPASSQLDGFVADGDIENEDYDFRYYAADDGGCWLVYGVSTSLITLLSAT